VIPSPRSAGDRSRFTTRTVLTGWARLALGWGYVGGRSDLHRPRSTLTIRHAVRRVLRRGMHTGSAGLAGLIRPRAPGCGNELARFARGPDRTRCRIVGGTKGSRGACTASTVRGRTPGGSDELTRVARALCLTLGRRIAVVVVGASSAWNRRSVPTCAIASRITSRARFASLSREAHVAHAAVGIRHGRVIIATTHHHERKTRDQQEPTKPTE